MAHTNMLFYPLYYNIISLTSKNHIGISFITWFCKKSNSDNVGSTVYLINAGR